MKKQPKKPRPVLAWSWLNHGQLENPPGLMRSRQQAERWSCANDVVVRVRIEVVEPKRRKVAP